MKGSVLVVTHNNLECTKQAIKSVLAQDIPCDILVADNVSTDNTVAWLRTKPVATIHYPYQKSLAALWNAGLKAFWKIGATEVLVINNDVVLRSDTYRMLAGMQLPLVTAISVNYMNQIGTAGDRDWDTLAKTARPHPDFSCFMIKPYVTDNVGWFDEEYFPAYVEDCDYHVRMHKAHIPAVCVDLPFLHLGARTLGTASEGEANRVRRGADQNRERFRRKYGCFPGSPEYSKLFV